MSPKWICLKCGECDFTYVHKKCERCGWRRPLDKEKVLKMLMNIKGNIIDE